jgi:hypothetical protein
MDGEHGVSLTCILGALLGVACSAPSRQETGGLFWAGVADGGPWLVYLRPGSDSSAAYQPPEVLAVCYLRVLGGGEVSFRTSRTGDGAAYRFVGPWSASGLTGSMRQARMQPGMMVDTQPLDLRRIATTLLADSKSTSEAYAEAGPRERSGVEVVLVDAPEGVVGVYFDHDGEPAGIRSVTGARHGDVLRLSFQASTRPAVDTARIRGDTLILHGGRLRLVKRLALAALFRGPDRGGCDE